MILSWMTRAEIVLDGLKSKTEQVWLKPNILKMKDSSLTKSEGAPWNNLSQTLLGSGLSGKTTAYVETAFPVTKRAITPRRPINRIRSRLNDLVVDASGGASEPEASETAGAPELRGVSSSAMVFPIDSVFLADVVVVVVEQNEKLCVFVD